MRFNSIIFMLYKVVLVFIIDIVSSRPCNTCLMDDNRDHKCASREDCECGVIVPCITLFTSTCLGHIETCTRNHSHGETLNVLTSTGSVRGCSGYEVVPTNVIRTALILEFHTQPCILHGQIICSSQS